MKTSHKILLGGLGALTPIIINLVVVDFEVVFRKATMFATLGYSVKVIVLFYLGGLVAWLHKTEMEPIKLFELGIVAPALLIAYSNGTNVVNDSRVATFTTPITSAHAGPEKFEIQAQNPFSISVIRPPETKTQQFFRGFLGNFGVAPGELPKNTALLAAAGEELAFGTPEFHHSMFTEFLLRGLNGRADITEDGTISVRELSSYLGFAIPAYTEKRNFRQVPLAQISSNFAVAGKDATYRKVFALVIGIDRYEDRAIAPIVDSVRSAKAIAHFINTEYRERDLQLTMLNDSDARRENVQRALYHIVNNAKPKDLVLAYFSGHSVRGASGRAQFVMYDSKLKNETTLIPIDQIAKLLNDMQSASKLLIVDSRIYLPRHDIGPA